jgi:hypothetical protein
MPYRGTRSGKTDKPAKHRSRNGCPEHHHRLISKRSAGNAPDPSPSPRAREGLGCRQEGETGYTGWFGKRDRIVNRGAPAFVEDLDAEDLGCAHGAVFVGTGDGHVKGQDLVAVPGSYDFLKLSGLSDLNGIELIDGGSGVELSAEIALYGRAEDGCSGCRGSGTGDGFRSCRLRR